MIKKIMSFAAAVSMAAALLPGAPAALAEENGNHYLQEKQRIEEMLNLRNNPGQTWTYSSAADAWTLSVVSAVAYPELEENEGVSVCVPGAYVTGIDRDGDGTADVVASDSDQSAEGSLVIDYDAVVTSSNGQVYTASTAPLILNTGAAGYSSSANTLASTLYAAEGYINIACGNRGKQSTATDENGSTYYTGDAPSCLVDQKAAARFVKYNILLGNLPGDVDRLISTGGSGGGAHATMFAATGNNPVYYDYQQEVGAVGVYRNAAGAWITTVNINGEEVPLSDSAWGCVAYSAITSLYEADMAMAFEYTLDSTYEFSTPFQKQLAAYLSEEYMNYINAQNLTVKEADAGFDLDADGELNSTVALTIEYDSDTYPETNGYHGTYLDLYLAEFRQNLEWYLANLDYADGWTWFAADGNVLTDEQAANLTLSEKMEAFIEGRYAASSTRGRMMGGPGGPQGNPDGMLEMKGNPGKPGNPPDMPRHFGNTDVAANSTGDEMDVGTPDMGTTQSSGSTKDSANYSSYPEMLAAYADDIDEVCNGKDRFGNNQVQLYNPLYYIGSDGTENPTWVRIMMGASEGDISMFNSLNLQIALLNAGVDANIEWQWNGGHVPSEIFGESLSLYVDRMVARYDEAAVKDIEKAEVHQQTNGTASAASGKDISSWVTLNENGTVDFSLAAAAKYRTDGASKATPGFDVMDYGQEDYVFGSPEKDARHWDVFVLNALKEHADTLETLFNRK